jgi:hypothetical protein
MLTETVCVPAAFFTPPCDWVFQFLESEFPCSSDPPSLLNLDMLGKTTRLTWVFEPVGFPKAGSCDGAGPASVGLSEGRRTEDVF